MDEEREITVEKDSSVIVMPVVDVLPDVTPDISPVPIPDNPAHAALPDTEPSLTTYPVEGDTATNGNTAYTPEMARHAVRTGGAGGNSAIEVPGDKNSRQKADADNRKAGHYMASLAAEVAYSAAYKTVVTRQREVVKKEEQKLAKLQAAHDQMSSLMNQLQFKLHEWDIAQQELARMTVEHTAAIQQTRHQMMADAGKYISDLQKAREGFHANLLEKQAEIEQLISKTDDRFYKLDIEKFLKDMGHGAEAEIYRREMQGLDSGYVFKEGDTYYTFEIKSAGNGNSMEYTIDQTPVTNPTLLAEIEYAVQQGEKLISKEEASAIVNSVAALQNAFGQTQFDAFMKRQEDLNMEEKIAGLEKGIEAQKEYIKKIESDIAQLANKLGMAVDRNDPDIASIKQQYLEKKQEQNRLHEAIKAQEIIVSHQRAFLSYMETDAFEKLYKEKIGSRDAVISVSIEKDILTVPGIYDPKFIAQTAVFMEKQGFTVIDIPENIKKIMPEVKAEMEAQAEAVKKAEASPKPAPNSSVASSVDGRPALPTAPKIGENFAASAMPAPDKIQPAPVHDTNPALSATRVT